MATCQAAVTARGIPESTNTALIVREWQLRHHSSFTIAANTAVIAIIVPTFHLISRDSS
jgi:hypothetical protein